jgi:potassium/hydrogen antiporter
VSVISSKASGRLGVPALLVFLLIGMLAGSEGPGGIYFADAQIAQFLGIVALVFILFSGGMDTSWEHVRPVLWKGVSLSTLGVLTTATLVGAFATLVLGFSFLEGMLLGAIVSSTDAAAVFAILRSRSVGLRGQIAPLIELESGSNDPMAVFLVTALVSLLINPAASVLGLVPMFIQQMVLGGLLGFLLGKGMVLVLNRVRLEYEGLYSVFTIALVLFVYSATAVLGGNGFLAVYIAGLVMGNRPVIHQRSIMRFHDGIAWLMQIVMFLVLGLLVFPSRLLPVVGASLLVALFLTVVARPVSVFISLLFSRRMEVRDKAMVSWVGLRGAVPIILATFPLLAGVERAQMIFDLVFFIVVASVLVQGTSIPQVAGWLGVGLPSRQRPRAPLQLDVAEGVTGELIEIELPENAPAVGKRIVDLGLPPAALFVLIGKDDHFFVPSGGTRLEAGDVITLLADPDSLEEVRRVMALE